MNLIRLTLVVLWTPIFAAGLCAVPDQVHAQRSRIAIQGRKRIIGHFGPRFNSVKVRVTVPRGPLEQMYYGLPKYTPPRLSAGDSTYSAAITAYDGQHQNSAAPKVTSAPVLQRSAYGADASSLKIIDFPIIHTLDGARDFQLDAEKAFRSGNYHQSARLVESATRLDPSNGLLKLFSSQVNFAIGRYRVAATDLETATILLGAQEWGFFGDNFRKFYGRNDYVRQTRSLVDHVQRRPDDYQAKVLLGYHYGIAGHRTSATELFHRALRLNPEDLLAQRLIPAIGDPTLPTSGADLIEAPTPETDSNWIRKRSQSASRMPPKRIYLTSQFAHPQPAAYQVQQPMSADELIEAPADVFIPQLDGPRGNRELPSVLEESLKSSVE